MRGLRMAPRRRALSQAWGSLWLVLRAEQTSRGPTKEIQNGRSISARRVLGEADTELRATLCQTYSAEPWWLPDRLVRAALAARSKDHLTRSDSPPDVKELEFERSRLDYAHSVEKPMTITRHRATSSRCRRSAGRRTSSRSPGSASFRVAGIKPV